MGVLGITNASATINWTTDDISNSTVYYGVSAGNLAYVSLNQNMVKNHTVPLNSLENGIQYYYKIKSCNENALCSNSSTYSFTTLDSTAPAIDGLQLNVLDTTALITWSTGEASDSKVYYGLTPSLGAEKSNLSLTNSHAINLSGLQEFTAYFYKASSCDSSANCANSSIGTFMTEDYTAPNPPANLTLEVNNSNNNIRIRWSKPEGEEPAKYNIYIYDQIISRQNVTYGLPNATATANEYVDNEASMHSERYYLVTSEDAIGNEQEIASILMKYDLKLSQGYNLVHLPVIPFDSGVKKMMHHDAAYHPVNEIIRYDRLNQQFRTIKFDSETEEWNTSFDFFVLQPSEAYFFNSEQQNNFTVVGYLPEYVDVELVEGMNLAGLTVSKDKPIGEAILQSPVDYNITEVSSRRADGSYSVAAYYNGTNEWFMADGFNITRGEGYWVKANKNFTLRVSGNES